MVELIIIATMFSSIAMQTVALPDMATCLAVKEILESNESKWWVDKPTVSCTCVQLWDDE